MKRVFLILIAFTMSFAVTFGFTRPASAAPVPTVPTVVAWGSLKYDKYSYAMIDTMKRYTVAAPAGALVTLDTYLYNDMVLTNLFKDACKRGVNIQLVVDKTGANNQLGFNGQPGMADQLSDLTNYFTANKKACPNSFVKQTAGSPFSTTGYQHAKSFTVSAVGTGTSRKQYISSWTGNNVTYSNTLGSWGESRWLVGNKTIYDALVAYHKQLLVEKTRSYYKVVTSGDITLYFNPSFAGHKDVIESRLSKITNCSGVDIQIVMFTWGNSRASLARQLKHLANLGCHIRLITDWTGPTSLTVGHMVWDELYAPGKGKIDISSGFNKDAGMHLKLMLIKYNHSQVVINGSRNLTGGTSTCEITGEDTSAANFATYNTYVNRLRAVSHAMPTKPVYPTTAVRNGIDRQEQLDD